MKSFAQLGLLPSLLGTLKTKGLTQPTEIQVETVPKLLAGKSIVGIARTGTGKTLAYVLPILHRLKSMEYEGNGVTKPASPRALVIAPTRELAEQVTRVFKQYTHQTRIRVRSVMGGTTAEVSKNNLTGAIDVMVATPTRLLKLLDKKLVSLSDVQILILDEADQMLDPGFLGTVKRISKECHADVQRGLFSATISPNVQSLINEYFPTTEKAAPKSETPFSPTLKTKEVFVENGHRFPFLEAELKKKVEGSTLIFVNTREQCDELAKQLTTSGHKCVVCRGEMERLERRANLKAFREGKVSLMVSTDLAARGLDVDGVYRVINYHLPRTKDNYVHRVGRTARAGKQGLVVNLVTRRDKRLEYSMS
jgi:ATP-dependent RNA helicase RhlE